MSIRHDFTQPYANPIFQGHGVIIVFIIIIIIAIIFIFIIIFVIVIVFVIIITTTTIIDVSLLMSYYYFFSLPLLLSLYVRQLAHSLSGDDNLQSWTKYLLHSKEIQ